MKKNSVVFFGLFLTFVVIVFGITLHVYSKIQTLYSSFAYIQNSNNTDAVLFDLTILPNFLKIVESTATNSIISTVIPKKQKELIQSLAKITPDLLVGVNELIQGEQRWLFVFQNSNEIRATGGFMGSYAIVTIREGKILSIETEDIYDADGQFSGYFDAPPGVKEYLSSGKGLRLPDANWNPDTVKSAEQILPFFAFGSKQNIAGIVFVNLDFAKHLLELLGPIELPDYNTIVTSENIDEVLRSRRDTFFPGSIQKKHMLSQLLSQVRIKISTLAPDKIAKLSQLITNELKSNTLQFYSINQKLDEIFSKHDMRQTIQIPENSDYLFLVESNVGINKANKHVSRSISVEKQSGSRTINISFANANKKPTTSKLTDLTNSVLLELQKQENASSQAKPANHLAYINYQRILVPENWELKSIESQGKVIDNFDSQILEINEHKIKQVGFLLVVLEENTTTVTIQFKVDTKYDTIYIQKQPGLPNTLYNLEYNTFNSTHELSGDQLLPYPTH